MVKNREDRFLHFAGIPGAADDHHFAFERNDDEYFGTGAVDFRISLQARSVQNGEFRCEVAKFFFLRLNEHVARKKIVPCIFVDHANR